VKFEWDAQKAELNFKKHGVTFEEASTVFGDPLAATVADARHSIGESRLATAGQSSASRLVVVAHVDRVEHVRTSASVLRRDAREGLMNQEDKIVDDADMLPEYDFSRAVRGKYYERYRQGPNVVLLDPDVSEVFRTRPL
jgi:uncharacterized DUF497 family protein